MRESVWHVVIILLFTGTVFFTNLGGSRLWDRDEPRNAGCAAEMMARGDWIVPMFNDELRHQKPVLLYWLIMSAYSIFGVNEFSARFWSAALAVGTTFATYGIARRLTNPTVALYAAVALSTSLMFDVAARAATPDSLLTFCGTSALLFYVLGTFGRSANEVTLKCEGKWFTQNKLMVVAMYGMLGLGVLAKGPVGFVLPMTIIGLFMLIKTRQASEPQGVDSISASAIHWTKSCWQTLHPFHFWRTLCSMRPLVGATIVLLIATPWYWLVHVRTDGDFTQMFFVGEHFGRATRAMESHSGGLWFYPVAILVGFFPWSILWGPVAVGLMTRRFVPGPDQPQPIATQDSATTLMLCWLAVQVGAFSLVQTKLPSYVTPCYPALAILTAICLHGLATRQSSVGRGWFFAALGGLVISGLAIAVGAGFATAKFLPGQSWLIGIGLIPLVGGGVLIWLLLKKREQSLPAVFAVTALLFCTGLFGFGTVSLDTEQHSHQVLNKIRPGAPVGAYGVLESSWVFYAGQPLTELEFDPDLVDRQSTPTKLTRDKFWQPKLRPTLEAFLELHPEAMLITTDEYAQTIKGRLPDDFELIQSADYFLKDKKMVLLGRPARRSDPADRQAEIQKSTRTQSIPGRR